MTAQQIVGLAVRLFSLWMLVITMQMIAIAMAMNAQFQNAAAFALYIVPVLCVALAIFLWLFPMTVAHKLVPKSNDTEVLKMPARDAATAGAAIIGMWAIVISLPHLVAAGGIALQGWDHPLFSAFFDRDRFFALLPVAVQAAIGLFLVSRAGWVSNKIFAAVTHKGG